MRGRDPPCCNRRWKKGITPAYAGKSRCRSRMSPDRWDHPRVCGEEVNGEITDCQRPGSPPRMRGRVLPDRGRVVGVGITPAYAGKSSQRPFMLTAKSGSPPRMRGRGSVRYRVMKLSGSPPRMRGREAGHRYVLALLGITPAYAGKRFF